MNDSDTTNDFYTLRINTDADAASDINVKLTGTENQITELFRAEASKGAINGFMYFKSEVLLDQDYFESLKLIKNFNSGVDVTVTDVINGTRERVVINGTDHNNIIKADVSTWNGHLNVYAHDGNDNVQITTKSYDGLGGVNTYVDPNTLVTKQFGTLLPTFYNQGTEKGVYVMTGGSDSTELSSASTSNGISNKIGDSSGFDTISELIYDPSGHATANMTFDEIGVVANGLDEDGQVNIRIEERAIDTNGDLLNDGSYVEMVLDIYDSNTNDQAFIELGEFNSGDASNVGLVSMRYEDSATTAVNWQTIIKDQQFNDIEELYKDNNSYTVREASPSWDGSMIIL